jgi:thioredoxin reductase (NADPH)
MSSASDELYDVIIIGGASAGLTAALYTSRQGLKTLVVTKDVGGQALLTNDIQNYPGFMTIGGFDLTQKFEEQAKFFGTRFIYDEAVEIRERDDCPGACYAVRTSSGDYSGPVVILAFGKTPRDLGVPGEQKLKGKGVSYCAVCDGPFFKGRIVSVIGSFDPAMDATQILAGLAKKVYLVHSFDKPMGDEELLGRVSKRENVELVPNSRVLELKGESKLTSLVLENSKSKARSELPVDGAFIELGYVAKTKWIKELVQLNPAGEIVVDQSSATSRPGIFAAGDITSIPFKQAIISAGQGATAALSAYNYLMRMRGRSVVKADWKVLPVEHNHAG